MTDMSKYKELFVTEANEYIAKLNTGLIDFEKDAAKEGLLDDLMRFSHSLKGASALMGFKKMAFVTHVMEDVFDFARNGKLVISSDAIQELFVTIDKLQESLAAIKSTSKEMDLDERAEKLKELTGVKTVGIGRSKRSSKGVPTGVTDASPISDTKNDEIKLAKPTSTTMHTDEGEILAEQLPYIKVPVERIDGMMSLTEALLASKMELESLAKDSRASTNLKSSVSKFSTIVSDLQYQVMQTRLVPVEQIFGRFPRMVRDLAGSQKKKVDFTVKGGDIEFDRTIVDQLAEPIMHLLRNAIDHGFQGAKEGGTYKLLLEATRQKDNATITVQNNGTGIDWAGVVEAASKKGIIDDSAKNSLLGTAEDRQAIFDSKSVQRQEVEKLLFNPRLSTKVEITETSGRGVGLSVVKQFVDRVGGEMSVESPLEGGGCRFVMRLPVSLAIISTLLVKVGDHTYAVPFTSVERSVNVKVDDLKSMVDNDVAIVDGSHVPLVYLARKFNIKQAENDEDQKKLRDVKIVMVKYGKETTGLVVDDLLGDQEIVVKAMPKALRNLNGFSGSAILGDGKTILILDVPSLLQNNNLA